VTRRAARLRDDRASVAVELVLVTPLLLVLVLFVVALGRLVGARIELDGAAAQAARAASLQRDPAAASEAAQETASAALSGDHVTCADLTVSTNSDSFGPGGEVSVRLSCSVDLADLAGLRLPASTTLSASAVSVIDTYRESSP
jgi:Flp pilus assembly protein TadG